MCLVSIVDDVPNIEVGIKDDPSALFEIAAGSGFKRNDKSWLSKQENQPRSIRCLFGHGLVQLQGLANSRRANFLMISCLPHLTLLISTLGVGSDVTQRLLSDQNNRGLHLGSADVNLGLAASVPWTNLNPSNSGPGNSIE